MGSETGPTWDQIRSALKCLIFDRFLNEFSIRKTCLTLIDSAIQKSELGINPQIDGQIIRLRIPDLTEERRKDLIKVLKNMGEKGKISIRNIRREANEELKKKLKDKIISEDANKNFENIFC